MNILCSYTYIIMENTPQKDCKKCKQKGPGVIQIGTIILGFYIIISSVYGTMTFIKDIIEYFK